MGLSEFFIREQNGKHLIISIMYVILCMVILSLIVPPLLADHATPVITSVTTPPDITEPATGNSHKTILFIISYDNSLPFYQSLVDGFIGEINQQTGYKIEVVIEYLDITRYNDAQYLSELTDLYQYKIPKIQPDIIVANEWTAYELLEMTGIERNETIPVIFYGNSPEGTSFPPYVARFILPDTNEWTRGTISLIRNFFPGVQKIVVIAGNGVNEQIGLTRIKVDVDKMDLKIPIEYITNVTYRQLLDEVSALPQNTAIFYYLFVEDAEGTSYIPVEVLEDLHTLTKNPLFGKYDIFVGKGIIGGYVLSADKLGRAMAGTSLRILDGTTPEDITVNHSDFFEFMFDSRELLNYRIDSGKLPPGSIVLYQEESPLKKYFWLIVLIVLILLIETLLIAALVINRIRRMKAEKSLKESEERFRILVEQAPEAIIVFEPETDIIVIANKNAERLFNCKQKDLIGTKIERFYSDNQPDGLPVSDSIQNHVQRALTGEEVVFERLILSTDKRETFCEVRLVMLPPAISPLMRCSYIDITLRKQQETELERRVEERTSELEEARRAFQQANIKLTLLSSITRHDILNQVTALLGYLEFTSEECPGEPVRQYLENCRNITRMIKNQIEFTRTYENIGTKAPIWQNLHDIIYKVVNMEKLPFTSHLAIEGVSIYADSMLEKVFFTLVENAARHGDHVSNIWFSYEIRDTGLMIVYEDNGIGIPLAEKEQIFNRGYGKHTGYGLFISKEILAITDLTIREVGDPGKGARFEIIVPEGKYSLQLPKSPEDNMDNDTQKGKPDYNTR